MKRGSLPSLVGNEFTLPVRRVKPSTVSFAMEAPAAVGVMTPTLDAVNLELEPAQLPHFSNEFLVTFIRSNRLQLFAVILIIMAALIAQATQAYYAAHYVNALPKNSVVHVPASPKQGPNIVVYTSQLNSTLKNISSQPISVVIDGKSQALQAGQIKSWLKVAEDKQHKVAYIHVNKQAITKTLNDMGSPFVKTPVNEVTLPNAAGQSQVIASGKNGTQLGDITPDANQIEQSLLTTKGLNVNLPLKTVPFASITPANFDKLIEVNVNSKQMWAYDHGQLVKTFLVSAGAPATPTPIGQYKIYAKFAVQDMRGFNPNGTKYFQPHVHWINYFLPGGYAVHGVYWHPLSWFGAINSSHGCVGLSDDEAKWVYDWAQVGTTVITHY